MSVNAHSRTRAPRRSNAARKATRDANGREHETLVQALIRAVEYLGVKVRREELRRGPGWRTMSGQCRVQQVSFCFIDRTLPLQEQVALLSALLHERVRLADAVTFPSELLAALPESARRRIEDIVMCRHPAYADEGMTQTPSGATP